MGKYFSLTLLCKLWKLLHCLWSQITFKNILSVEPNFEIFTVFYQQQWIQLIIVIVTHIYPTLKRLLPFLATILIPLVLQFLFWWWVGFFVRFFLKVCGLLSRYGAHLLCMVHSLKRIITETGISLIKETTEVCKDNGLHFKGMFSRERDVLFSEQEFQGRLFIAQAFHHLSNLGKSRKVRIVYVSLLAQSGDSSLQQPSYTSAIMAFIHYVESQILCPSIYTWRQRSRASEILPHQALKRTYLLA